MYVRRHRPLDTLQPGAKYARSKIDSGVAATLIEIADDPPRGMLNGNFVISSIGSRATVACQFSN